MLFFTANLPNLTCDEIVRTLLTVQICFRKLGESSMKPIDILSEDVYKWQEVINDIVSIKRMQAIFLRSLKTDPISPNEIRIRHLTYTTRKYFNSRLQESHAIPKDVSMIQAYFCLNSNHAQYLTEYNCNQHFDLTLKLEEKICNELTIEEPIESKNDPEAEIMVIKLEPDEL